MRHHGIQFSLSALMSFCVIISLLLVINLRPTVTSGTLIPLTSGMSPSNWVRTERGLPMRFQQSVKSRSSPNPLMTFVLPDTPEPIIITSRLAVCVDVSCAAIAAAVCVVIASRLNKLVA
jgi:hypothetical protein